MTRCFRFFLRPLAGLVALLPLLAVSAADAVQPSPLAGRAWSLVALDGERIPADLDVFIAFAEDGRVSGRGGCNRFVGDYSVEADRLALGQLATTRMACPPPAMAVEDAFLAALEETAIILAHDGASLLLGDAKGAARLEFRRRDDE